MPYLAFAMNSSSRLCFTFASLTMRTPPCSAFALLIKSCQCHSFAFLCAAKLCLSLSSPFPTARFLCTTQLSSQHNALAMYYQPRLSSLRLRLANLRFDSPLHDRSVLCFAFATLEIALRCLCFHCLLGRSFLCRCYVSPYSAFAVPRQAMPFFAFALMTMPILSFAYPSSDLPY